jgi:hypothetical protein
MVESKGATGSAKCRFICCKRTGRREVSLFQFYSVAHTEDTLALHGFNSLLGVATYCLYLLSVEVEVSCVVIAEAFFVALRITEVRHRRQKYMARDNAGSSIVRVSTLCTGIDFPSARRAILSAVYHAKAELHCRQLVEDPREKYDPVLRIRLRQRQAWLSLERSRIVQFELHPIRHPAHWEQQ